MADKNKNPKPINKIILEYIESKNLTEKYSVSSIPIYWDSVVGELIASKTRVQKFEDGKLYIYSSSSIWKAEILLRKQTIIDDLNKKIGKKLVKELIIK